MIRLNAFSNLHSYILYSYSSGNFLKPFSLPLRLLCLRMAGLSKEEEPENECTVGEVCP